MMWLSEAAQATAGKMTGPDVYFSAVGTDSRKVQAGSLFVALRGENFDGHAFVADCLQKGAVAAMVSEQSAISNQRSDKPILVVQDTRVGLGDLAAHWRNKFAIPLAAITGSNGKTTVKEMLTAILREDAGADAVLATEGNLNNDIGVPKTLFRLNAGHQYAVLEMGMNHPGEIDYLSRLAQPSVALVNNAGTAHLQGLGSVEAVARAKGEIFAGLTDDGVAVVNADDTYAGLWRQLAAPRKVMTFGLDQSADVSAEYLLRADGVDFTLRTPQGEVATSLGVPGLHNLKNALAASAAALALGVALDKVSAGLRAFGGVKGRLQRKTGCCGAVLIDDTYNANPASMRAAIGVLAAMPGKRIFVMGDMGELGDGAAAMHRAVGIEAREAGIDQFYTLGDMGAEAMSGFGAGAVHVASLEALVAQLRPQLNEKVTVLVKGSRFMRMERVVEALTEKEGTPCC